MDFGTSEFVARAINLSDDAVRQEMKKLNLNANIYQLEKRRCCKRFNLEAESLPALLFYRIMKRDWDRTAAQFEKARGRIRVRKQPVNGGRGGVSTSEAAGNRESHIRQSGSDGCVCC